MTPPDGLPPATAAARMEAGVGEGEPATSGPAKGADASADELMAALRSNATPPGWWSSRTGRTREGRCR